MSSILSETESLCPVCFKRLPARRTAGNGNVYLEKTCPEHGLFKTLIWRAGAEDYLEWGWRSQQAAAPLKSITAADRGCPYDCGLCPGHKANTCTLIMEVTQRCNLRCPVCFARAGENPDYEPDLETIRKMYETALDTAGTPSVQLSGGEPTLREDLPEIISLGRKMGFEHIMVNTNGLRIAREKEYLKRLVDSGAGTIYLQFDGTDDEVYRFTRGENLIGYKTEAIRNCAELNIGVILVPVIIPGVNDHQIGSIVQFAKQRVPAVKGIHFQPISYFGRYPKAPSDEDRVTIPDVIRSLAQQTGGELKEDYFLPRRSEKSYCSFGSLFTLRDGRLLPLTSRRSLDETCRGGKCQKPPWELARSFMKIHWRSSGGPANSGSCVPGVGPETGLPSRDEFMKWVTTYGFTITGMPFQDVWSIDLERLQRCCTHVVTTDGRMIPFCAYYLTGASGKRLHADRRKSSVAGK